MAMATCTSSPPAATGAAAARKLAASRFIPESSSGYAATLRVCGGWICRDARAFPFTDQRAGTWKSFCGNPIP